MPETPPDTDSILLTIKKLLGIDEDYEVFDLDIITHINSNLMTLSQLGIGPKGGYMITGKDEQWRDFVGIDENLNAVRSYIHIKTRLAFDPPTNGFTITAFEKMAEEYAWRLNIMADDKDLYHQPPEGFWWEIYDQEGFPPEAEVGDLGFDPDTGNVWRKT